ncbi:MAG: hypothetical protein WCP20_18540 [Desulfuromonadales bacterium]
MSEMVYTVALAGLLHDVGKFMQRAEAPLSAEAKKYGRDDLSCVSRGIFGMVSPPKGRKLCWQAQKGRT